MSKKRISYGDRLLMGSIGNLEGLQRRLPTFESYDQDRVREVTREAGALQSKLESMLGGTSSLDQDQMRRQLDAQSANRSAGQEARHGRCPD